MTATRARQWRQAKSIVSILWVKQSGKCCYCEIEMIKPIDKTDGLCEKTATREHLKPKSNGGTDIADNLALACLKCNTSRPDGMSWLEYKTIKADEQ